MNKKVLFTALTAIALAGNANAYPVKHAVAKPAKQYVEVKDVETGETYVAEVKPEASATVAVEQPYTPTDGAINYNDKSISGYQDPYATNARAYKSNEYGVAATPPKANVFADYVPPTYRSTDPDDINTDAKTGSYVSSKNRKSQ